MATLKEVDHTAVDGSGKEPPTQEDAGGEQPHKTPERRRVDALIDISEEDFLTELEPHEYHCYSGWEEAVRGWARVAPLSCIFLTQKHGKPKHKGADNPAPLSVDTTSPNADASAGIAERPRESHVGPHNSYKKAMALHQHTGSWSSTAAAALQKNASEWPVKEKKEEDRTLRESPSQPHHLSSKYSVSENRPTKPQKHSHRPRSTVVPITNFTFLPPINSPHPNPQKVSSHAQEGETIEENCFLLDKKSGTKGTRVDPVANPEPPTYPAALTSKYRTCQHNPLLFSAASVALPKRYQVPMSSKPDIVHRTTYSMGKSLTQTLHSGTAACARAHMHPGKTVCAVKL